jgi:hypothetical protein
MCLVLYCEASMDDALLYGGALLILIAEAQRKFSKSLSCRSESRTQDQRTVP